MSLAETSIKRPVLATVMSLAILLFDAAREPILTAFRNGGSDEEKVVIGLGFLGRLCRGRVAAATEEF